MTTRSGGQGSREPAGPGGGQDPEAGGWNGTGAAGLGAGGFGPGTEAWARARG